jgi:hypothetical protein
MEQSDDPIETTGGTTVAAPDEATTQVGAPADRIRSLVTESETRGAPMVSAQAMQARLFAVYDDASAMPDALALVQRHLVLTLDRTWYSAEEVGQLADRLDWLLGLGALEAEIVPAEVGASPGGPGAHTAFSR